MRNTTKLKHLLLLYDCNFSMPTDTDIIGLSIIDKKTGIEYGFFERRYAAVVHKAFRFMMNALKAEG